MKYPVTKPEQEARLHPLEIYPQAEHDLNIELVQGYLDRFAEPSKEQPPITPWMLTAGGLARVQTTKKGLLKAEMVESRPYGHAGPGFAAHFVKNTVELDTDSVKTEGRYYPPYHYRVTIVFNRPLSAGWMMGYNMGARDPRGIGSSFDRHFDLSRMGRNAQADSEPNSIYEAVGSNVYAPVNPAISEVPATLENVTGLFAEHPTRLRRWVDVKLPSSIDTLGDRD